LAIEWKAKQLLYQNKTQMNLHFLFSEFNQEYNKQTTKNGFGPRTKLYPTRMLQATLICAKSK